MKAKSETLKQYNVDAQAIQCINIVQWTTKQTQQWLKIAAQEKWWTAITIGWSSKPSSGPKNVARAKRCIIGLCTIGWSGKPSSARVTQRAALYQTRVKTCILVQLLKQPSTYKDQYTQDGLSWPLNFRAQVHQQNPLPPRQRETNLLPQGLEVLVPPQLSKTTINLQDIVERIY